MKILFSTFYDPNYLGIRYLAASLKNAGHEVKICQLKNFRSRVLKPEDTADHTGYFIFSGWNFNSHGDSEFPITQTELGLFEEAIAEWQPDILAFTNRSPYNHLLPRLLPAMKRAAPHAFMVGGGFGPSLEPEFSLGLGADAVIRGEGEGAILDLVKALSEGSDWRGLENMAWLDRGQLVKNPLRPLIRDLDSLPFPIYYGDHFISIEGDRLEHADMRTRKQGGMYATAYTILTGRGCIGNCSYCAGGNWRNQYKLQGLPAPKMRLRSAGNVLEELKIARDHGEKYITFADEYLVRPLPALKKFFDDYAREINLPFFAHCHHRQLLAEENGKLPILEAAKKAGLNFIPIGVQSASEDFARKVYYRNNNNAEILQAINTFHKNGFSGNYHIIGGNPLETDEDIERMFDFCAQIPFDPSLRTRWFLHAPMLSLLKGAPLVEDHPELKSMDYSRLKFSETVLLAELRNKMDAESFAKLRKDPWYMGHPERLHALLWEKIRGAHMEYLMRESERLKGREIYFFGAGAIFKKHSPLFAASNPQCVLVDVGDLEPDASINGLPILRPENVLDNASPKPIVIFSKFGGTICDKISRKYPAFTDFVTCALE